METKLEILTELQEISPAVAAIESKNTFKVPDSYFDSLTANVLALVTETTINLPSPVNHYSIPETYFQDLPQQVIQRIKADSAISVTEELKQLSPFLSTIQKENVYSVPEGYFESLVAGKHQQNTHVSQPVLQKPVHSFRRSTRYAMAAAVFAIVAFSAYLLVGKQGVGGDVAAVQRIDVEELRRLNIASEMEKLPENEIEYFLAASPALYDVSYTVPVEDINLKSAIDNAAEEELEQYLEQLPSSGQDASKEI